MEESLTSATIADNQSRMPLVDQADVFLRIRIGYVFQMVRILTCKQIIQHHFPWLGNPSEDRQFSVGGAGFGAQRMFMDASFDRAIYLTVTADAQGAVNSHHFHLCYFMLSDW